MLWREKWREVISYQAVQEKTGQDNAEFFIRGVTSFGYANSPLILIDGFGSYHNRSGPHGPDNIASFSIMKDTHCYSSLWGSWCLMGNSP